MHKCSNVCKDINTFSFNVEFDLKLQTLLKAIIEAKRCLIVRQLRRTFGVVQICKTGNACTKIHTSGTQQHKTHKGIDSVAEV